MFKNSLLLIIAMALFIGCGYKESTIQKRDKGFFKFTKAYDQAYEIRVNKNYTIKLGRCYPDANNTQSCEDGYSENNIYEVDSGNVLLEVFTKEGEKILEKTYFLGSDTTIEVGL